MTDPIFDDIIHEGRPVRVTWRGAEFNPPRALVTQASGVCVTEDGRVVLVTKNGASWQLAGGHPEPGESIEQTFVREVAEETDAKVLDMRYLGAQEVSDPGNPDGKSIYYQARFWAKVRAFGQTPIQKSVQTPLPESGQTPFQADPERDYVEDVTGWRCFAMEEVRAALAWQTVNVLDQLLALTMEKD